MQEPLSERIAIARRHVEKGREIIDRQRKLINEGRLGAAEGLRLLALFEQSQEVFDEDLERLLREHDGQAVS